MSRFRRSRYSISWNHRFWAILSYLITFEVDGPELLRSCSVPRWHIYTHLAEGLYQGVYPGYPIIGPLWPHSEAYEVFEAVGLRLYVHSKGISIHMNPSKMVHFSYFSILLQNGPIPEVPNMSKSSDFQCFPNGTPQNSQSGHVLGGSFWGVPETGCLLAISRVGMDDLGPWCTTTPKGSKRGPKRVQKGPF